MPEKQIEMMAAVCLHQACVRESGSYMWVYVFLGNVLRGIGETPLIPLGFSYIDDFAKADESPFFIGEADFHDN